MNSRISFEFRQFVTIKLLEYHKDEGGNWCISRCDGRAVSNMQVESESWKTAVVLILRGRIEGREWIRAGGIM